MASGKKTVQSPFIISLTHELDISLSTGVFPTEIKLSNYTGLCVVPSFQSVWKISV